MRICIGWAFLLILVGVGPARGQEASTNFASISGTVTYRQRSALPPQAILRVRLEDVSKADAVAALIAEVMLPTRGRQVPLSFHLPYRPADIVSGHRYHLRASILIGNRVAFTSTRAYPVRADGTDEEIAMQVDPISPSRKTPPLVGTDWKLIELNGQAALEENQKAPSLQLIAAGRKIAGSGGVNRYFGTYTRSGSNLRLKPGGMTLMAGPEAMMQQEDAFIKALQAVTSYRIVGQTLELRKGSQLVARFQAQVTP
jgi:putative lipoprotein